MATVKGAYTDLTGSMGSITYRKLKDGRVVVSQKKVCHKAVRTKSNMMRMLPMGNVVAMARVLQDDVLERFEGCLTKVQARGKYIGLNLKRDVVYFTKEMQRNRCCVLVSHVISMGSLNAVGQRLAEDNCVVTDIRLAADITSSTTVREFTDGVLSLNPDYRVEDRLTLYYLTQLSDTDRNSYRVSLVRQRVTLDPRCADLLSQHVDTSLWCRRNGVLALASPLNGSAAAFVQQRPLRDGRWLVSPQVLLCVNPVAQNFATTEALDAAVESRGGYTDKGFLRPAMVGSTAYDVSETHSHLVTVFSNDESLGVVSTGRGTYMHGTEATLTAVPKAEARFVKWVNQRGEEVSALSVCRLCIVADASFTAYFEAV